MTAFDQSTVGIGTHMEASRLPLHGSDQGYHRSVPTFPQRNDGLNNSLANYSVERNIGPCLSGRASRRLPDQPDTSTGEGFHADNRNAFLNQQPNTRTDPFMKSNRSPLFSLFQDRLVTSRTPTSEEQEDVSGENTRLADSTMVDNESRCGYEASLSIASKYQHFSGRCSNSVRRQDMERREGDSSAPQTVADLFEEHKAKRPRRESNHQLSHSSRSKAPAHVRHPGIRFVELDSKHGRTSKGYHNLPEPRTYTRQQAKSSSRAPPSTPKSLFHTSDSVREHSQQLHAWQTRNSSLVQFGNNRDISSLPSPPTGDLEEPESFPIAHTNAFPGYPTPPHQSEEESMDGDSSTFYLPGQERSVQESITTRVPGVIDLAAMWMDPDQPRSNHSSDNHRPMSPHLVDKFADHWKYDRPTAHDQHWQLYNKEP